MTREWLSGFAGAALLVLPACGDIRRDVIVEQGLVLDAGGPLDPATDSDGAARCGPDLTCGTVSAAPTDPCADGGCATNSMCAANDPCQPYCGAGCTLGTGGSRSVYYRPGRSGSGRRRMVEVGGGGTSGSHP
jgi:hypothetical protein